MWLLNHRVGSMRSWQDWFLDSRFIQHPVQYFAMVILWSDKIQRAPVKTRVFDIPWFLWVLCILIPSMFEPLANLEPIAESLFHYITHHLYRCQCFFLLQSFPDLFPQIIQYSIPPFWSVWVLKYLSFHLFWGILAFHLSMFCCKLTRTCWSWAPKIPPHLSTLHSSSGLPQTRRRERGEGTR